MKHTPTPFLTKIESLLRKRWLWALVLLASYFLSVYWIGGVVKGAPWVLLWVLPVMDWNFCFGEVFQEWFFGEMPVVFFSSHLVIWSSLIVFLLKLRNMKSKTLWIASGILICFLTVTLMASYEAGQEMGDCGCGEGG